MSQWLFVTLSVGITVFFLLPLTYKHGQPVSNPQITLFTFLLPQDEPSTLIKAVSQCLAGDQGVLCHVHKRIYDSTVPNLTQ